RPDVSAVEQVGREIGSALRRRDRAYTVVLRSTALPGTTEGVLIPALSAGAGRLLDGPVRVAVNPEFMREGSSLHDFADPPFVLVGCADPSTAAVVRSLYDGVGGPFIGAGLCTAVVSK